MTAEEFETLKCGDCVRDGASDEVFMINQVRIPGYYAAVRVDPATLDRLSNELKVLASGEGRSLVPRKGIR